MHFNLIDCHGINIFNKNNTEMLYAINGLLELMKNSMKFFAPHDKSLLRLQNPDFFTPIKISWGNNNRTTALRIPNSEPEHKRIEHRVSSNHSNLESILCTILLATGFGLKNKIIPIIPKIFGNAFDKQYQLLNIPNSKEKIDKIPPIDKVIDWQTFKKINH